MENASIGMAASVHTTAPLPTCGARMNDEAQIHPSQMMHDKPTISAFTRYCPISNLTAAHINATSQQAEYPPRSLRTAHALHVHGDHQGCGMHDGGEHYGYCPNAA